MYISVALGTAGEMLTESFERHGKLVMLDLGLVPAMFMLGVKSKQFQKKCFRGSKDAVFSPLTPR